MAGPHPSPRRRHTTSQTRPVRATSTDKSEPPNQEVLARREVMAGNANTLARPSKSAEAIPTMSWRHDARSAHHSTNDRSRSGPGAGGNRRTRGAAGAPRKLLSVADRLRVNAENVSGQQLLLPCVSVDFGLCFRRKLHRAQSVSLSSEYWRQQGCEDSVGVFLGCLNILCRHDYSLAVIVHLAGQSWRTEITPSYLQRLCHARDLRSRNSATRFLRTNPFPADNVRNSTKVPVAEAT
jgi:hypothetical protein